MSNIIYTARGFVAVTPGFSGYNLVSSYATECYLFVSIVQLFYSVVDFTIVKQDSRSPRH